MVFDYLGRLLPIRFTSDSRKVSGMLDNYQEVIANNRDKLVAVMNYHQCGYFSFFTPYPTSRNLGRFDEKIIAELERRRICLLESAKVQVP